MKIIISKNNLLLLHLLVIIKIEKKLFFQDNFKIIKIPILFPIIIINIKTPHLKKKKTLITQQTFFSIKKLQL
jgi:hypothetical protein